MIKWQRSAVGTAHAFVRGDTLSLCKLYTMRSWAEPTGPKIRRCTLCVDLVAVRKRAHDNMNRAYSRKALRASKIV